MGTKRNERLQRTVLMGQRLWQQAERDFESARLALQPRSYYVAAYLAHQAAEKSLKAAHWHLRGEEAPWTHDVRDLAERLAEHAEDIPTEVRAAVAVLEPMLERTRYPSSKVDEPIPADLVSEHDARAAIQSTEGVMEWVQTMLQRPAKETQPKKRSQSNSQN